MVFINNAKEKISVPQEEPQYKYGIQVNIFDVIEDKLMRNKHITQMLIEAGISKTKPLNSRNHVILYLTYVSLKQEIQLQCCTGIRFFTNVTIFYL
jgi:hypothetical protein